MSKLPLDIVNFNDDFKDELDNAITIANGIQTEFIFAKVSTEINRKFQILNFDEIDSDEFFSKANTIKKDLKGFFPYIFFFSNSPLKGGGWSNLFADSDLESSISIITTDNVPDKIIPKDKMISYFLYYFARGILKFILADRMNHEKPSLKGCLFDFMENKLDLLKSMRPNAICDECRRELINGNYSISEHQLHSIDTLLSKAGSLLKTDELKVASKRKIFIGSSTEGLDVARKIKASLKFDAHVDTWADGLFDKPGQAYIEVLENILVNYEFGIFVFTPDDKLFSRGQISAMPRDNVIFEYGMFLGKHSRKKAFFIVPRGVDIKIMTDVLGITSLNYDPTNSNVQSAVSDACDQIREIINAST
jgi:predicted nucleotide-binding protein